MGGSSSSCSKQDHIDPKPSIDTSVGLSVATSEECASCSLSFPLGNTASASNMTRDGDAIVLRPFAPFVAVFNGRRFEIPELRVYYPAPMRTEGVQADAVVQCNSGNDLKIFIPIKKGSSGSFLSSMAQHLDPATSEFTAVDSKTGAYKQIDITTDQSWSLTTLVSDKDPYFTWVDSTLEQYVKSDLKCDRYLGWRSTPGPQVIYFQHPVSASEGDVNKLKSILGAVLPKDVISSVTNPLYFGGSVNCPAPVAPAKPPSSSAYSANVTMIGNVFAYFISVLLVLLAVAIVSFGVQSVTGIRLISDFSSTAKEIVKDVKPSKDASLESSVFAGAEKLLRSAASPTAALGGIAAAGQAKALSTAAVGQTKLANVTNALKTS